MTWDEKAQAHLLRVRRATLTAEQAWEAWIRTVCVQGCSDEARLLDEQRVRREGERRQALDDATRALLGKQRR